MVRCNTSCTFKTVCSSGLAIAAVGGYVAASCLAASAQNTSEKVGRLCPEIIHNLTEVSSLCKDAVYALSAQNVAYWLTVAAVPFAIGVIYLVQNRKKGPVLVGDGTYDL
ncbi:MAG: hypothetical protein JSR37_00740 [Verrucomicrobia bacterium]|nr:hypothetical protein [Verrucomicrobiota bacterium]